MTYRDVLQIIFRPQRTSLSSLFRTMFRLLFLCLRLVYTVQFLVPSLGVITRDARCTELEPVAYVLPKNTRPIRREIVARIGARASLPLRSLCSCPYLMPSTKAIVASVAVIIVSLLALQLPVQPGRFLLPTATSGNM